MTDFTRSEKNLTWLMKIYVPMFGIAGFLFLLFPDYLLGRIDFLTEKFDFIGRIGNKTGATGSPAELFWVFMSFSMMMTITACCYVAAKDVRKNRVAIIPVIVSKFASSSSAFVFYLFAGHTLAHLVIFMTDFPLFVITYVFFLRAHMGIIPEAYRSSEIDKSRYKPMLVGDEPVTVAAFKDEDKFKAMDKVLEETKFFDILKSYHESSGKDKQDFSIVVKPNFMMTYDKRDITTYTDPELVEYLFDKMFDLGFTNLTMVESQNTYGNYFRKRDVLSVAKYVGYSDDKNYRIVDLTQEKVEYDYGGSLGKHWVGPTWKDADFRVSFAKNKTHSFCYYTLTIKNIYGTTPLQNKFLEYHKKREFDWPTIEMLKHFPVHFGLIDAYISGDGQLAVIADITPKKTQTIIGGEKLVAVDWIGAQKMGLDPLISRFQRLAVREFGKPVIHSVGDMSVYESWENVETLLMEMLALGEESWWVFSHWFMSVGLVADTSAFPLKTTSVVFKPLRKLIEPLIDLFFVTRRNYKKLHKEKFGHLYSKGGKHDG